MADNASPLPEPLLTALNRLADVLPVHGAKYALIGGIAIGFRGRMRFTDDIDLLLNVPQIRLPGLLEALVELGFDCDVISTIREWKDHHFVVLGYVKATVRATGKPFETEWVHIITMKDGQVTRWLEFFDTAAREC